MGIIDTLKKGTLVHYTILGSILGIALGFVMISAGASSIAVTWVGFFGHLFIRALTFLVLPIVVLNVILGVNVIGEDTGNASISFVAKRTVLMYTLTTVLAIIEGLVLTQIVASTWEKTEATTYVQPAEIMRDSGALIKLGNLKKEGYFTEEEAYFVDFQVDIAGEMVNKRIEPDSISRHYESMVAFHFPVYDFASGSIDSFKVLSMNESTTFVVENEEGVLTLTSESGGNELSDSIINLFEMLVPNNIGGMVTGCPEGGCSADLLSVIVVSVVFGAILVIMRNRYKRGDNESDNTLYDMDYILPLVSQLNDIFMYMIQYVIKLTPVAVLSLIASAIAANELEELESIFSSLGSLLLAMYLGFGFHVVVVMSLIYWVVTRKNPWKHLLTISRAPLTAFATASSAATLPTTMAVCGEEGLKQNEGVTSFVLSLGATINMDGTGLYIPSIIIWLAAQSGITLTVQENVVMAIVATLASAGASPTPGLTPITILVWKSVFPTQPVPAEISFVMAIDWLTDRFVTVTNVSGDTFVSAILNHWVTNGHEDDFDLDAAAVHRESMEIKAVDHLLHLGNRASKQVEPEDDIESSSSSSLDATPAKMESTNPSFGM